MDFNPVEMAHKVLQWMAEECNKGRDRFFTANTIATQFSISDRQARDILGVLHHQEYATSSRHDGNLEGWPYTWCELTNKGLVAALTPPQKTEPHGVVIINSGTLNIGSIYGPAIQAISEAHETNPEIAEQLSALVTALQSHIVSGEEQQRETADLLKFLASQLQQNPPKGIVSAAVRYLREIVSLSADLATFYPVLAAIAKHYGVNLPSL